MAERRPRQVVLVRHGATDWSQQSRHTGWTDIPLNKDGVRQAGALTARLSSYSFDVVLCSTLQRAVVTCRSAGYGDVEELDPDLREWNYGDYEGKTAAEIRERDPHWNLWDEGVLNGETLDAVAARADRVIARVRRNDGDVAVFAHGHLLRVFASRWIGQGPHVARYLNLATASVSTLAWEHDWPSITLWNDTSHLRGLG